MEKNKKVTLVVIAAVVVLATVGGGGYTVWHKHQVSLAAAKLATDDGAASINGDDTTVAEQQTASAGGSGSSASGSGVLSAHSANGAVGSNSNMGQLLPAQHQQSAGSSSSSSSGVSNPFDPTTFEQYEKYKSGNQALFGDAQKGTGDELTEGKKAAVYYRGWLTNGQLFDESRAGSDGKLQPFVFQMGAHQVIAGWEQALTGMKVGGVRLVVVPPAVGYGAQAQASIPANSVLIFQVQLAAVQ